MKVACQHLHGNTGRNNRYCYQVYQHLKMVWNKNRSILNSQWLKLTFFSHRCAVISTLILAPGDPCSNPGGVGFFSAVCFFCPESMFSVSYSNKYLRLWGARREILCEISLASRVASQTVRRELSLNRVLPQSPCVTQPFITIGT